VITSAVDTMLNNFHVRNSGAASPSVAKLIRKFESMSTTAAARNLRGRPSVSKLVENYELLSCAAVSCPLRGKSMTGGRQGGKGGPGASPLQPAGPPLQERVKCSSGIRLQ